VRPRSTGHFRRAPADAQLDVNAVPQVPSSHMTGAPHASSAAVQAAAVTQVDGADPETAHAEHLRRCSVSHCRLCDTPAQAGPRARAVAPSPGRTRLDLGESSSQVDRPRCSQGPWSCIGTRLANRDRSVPLTLAVARRSAVRPPASGQPPPVVGIAQIWRSANTGGRLCRVGLPLPGGGEVRGRSRRNCASRPEQARAELRLGRPHS
jgi:hypothetical protein